MIRAGELQQLIIIERAATVEDDHGQEVSTWGEHTRARAKVLYGTGQERRAVSQEGGVQAATFICRRTPNLASVMIKDRISTNGETWDVDGIAPISLAEIHFTAVRSI